MSKKIDVTLTVKEIEYLLLAIRSHDPNVFYPVYDKLEEKRYLSLEDHELTKEEYHEKYGPFRGDD